MLSTTLPSQLEPQSSPTLSPAFFPAHDLGPDDRISLAVRGLAGEPVSQLAGESAVSRKFVYQQMNKAEQALDKEFQPIAPEDKVLFYIPVTLKWIYRVIIALVLHCRASIHGVQDFLHDAIDYHLSVGTIQGVVQGKAAQAREINAKEDLSAIRVGLKDEIFQSGKPILVGVDPKSTYCYLLKQEAQRDGTTWGYHILVLKERGFNPDYTVADAAKGLRSGQAEASPETPCWGDHFHCLYDFGNLSSYLDNRAYRVMESHYKVAKKVAEAQRKLMKKNDLGEALAKIRAEEPFDKKLAIIKREEKKAMSIGDTVHILGEWLRKDVLDVNGPDAPTRRYLFDFIVSELKQLEGQCPDRIRAVRVALENQREDLLAFAEKLDQRIGGLSEKWQMPENVARSLINMSQFEEEDPRYWQMEEILWKRYGERCLEARLDIERVTEGIVTASSMVENLNSRLRNYFELRKILKEDYLELLRFFLNNRRYPRSRIPERKNKSPAEMLKGHELPTWLEQLGFPKHSRAA